ncbi:hypothetical protein [Streptomyces sp. XY431]|uniref:hypothetical protein n=1 Tax=Streptomyces sp. XY431 TaxID=1415562 RepID=UPI00133143D7|nr:hypothetical protein [Streptomyces sp. XY431]
MPPPHGGRPAVWAAARRGRRARARSSARSLYQAGRYEDLLALYESSHPQTHLLRVRSNFLQTEER